MSEIWIYSKRKKSYIKATKWDLFWNKLKYKFTKWKLVNTYKYWLIPYKDKKKYFSLSNKEYEEAEKLYKEKGTISYEFYPCGGVGWGVRLHVLKTNEIIDISDVDSW